MLESNIHNLIYKEDLSAAYFKSVVEKIKTVSSVALFGAGTGGIHTYDFLRKYGLHNKVVCFIDNNSRKQGDFLRGVSIVSLDHFKKLNPENYLILVSCGEGDEIRRQCIDSKIPENKVLIPDLTLLNVPGIDYQFIWNHISEFDFLYHLLSDDWSRRTLINLLNYKITHDLQLIKQICDDSVNQYFDKELIDFSDVKTFVDCGAYTGDTIDSLLNKYHFDGGEVLCFETDEGNFSILKQHISEIEKKYNIKGRCYNLAVWSKTDTLHFNAIGSGSGFIDPAANIKVCAEPLDKILAKEKVDFIKMDIEGAEINAIAGAFNIIQENCPILAISVYHKPEDLFQIPMLIKAFNPNYKLYLRHYREYSITETVCYAIP